MLFKQRYTFNKIDQDLAPDKRDTSTHWNIVNMETFLTSRGASLQVAKGPELIEDTGNVLENYYVIGDGNINDRLFIFVTKNNTETPNFTELDRIIEVIITEATITLQVIQTGYWGFSTYYPIDCRGVYEHEDSEKLYWVDGLSQARFINVEVPTEEVDYIRTNPGRGMITAVPYGVVATVKAVVRYGYTQYNLGGSESNISEFTNPINISTTGDSAKINISTLSDQYTHFRVYRIMWETYNSAPSYSIIAEGINSTSVEIVDTSVEIVDTGSLFISALSIEEFTELGSDLIVPNTIEAKKQRLFYGNYKSEPFTIADNLDLRVYGFSSSSVLTLNNAEGTLSKTYTGFDDPDLVDPQYDESLDAVNPDKSTFKYQANGSTEGLEGVYTSIQLVREEGGPGDAKTRQFKQGETYRVGIVCQDTYGRSSDTNWVGDLKIPYAETELENTGYKPYYKVQGTLKSIPTGSGIVSWKFVYVQRNLKDRSIILQGIVQPVMDYRKVGIQVGIHPFPNIKEVKGNGNTSTTGTWFDTRVGYLPDYDFPDQKQSPKFSEANLYDPKVNMVFTPDVFIRRADIPGTAVRAVGVAKINPTYDYTRLEYDQPSRNDAFVAQTFPGVQFDLYQAFYDIYGQSVFLKHAPHCLFGGYNSNELNTDVYAYYMYTRRADRFYLSSDYTNSHTIEFCRYLGEDGTVTVDSAIISNIIDEKAYAGLTQPASTPWVDDNGDPCNYTGEFGECFVFKAEEDDWAGSFANYSNFADAGAFGSTVDDRGFPIVDVLQILNQQYGGSSFEARSFNYYIDASEGNNNPGEYRELYGDIYNGIYYFAKGTSARNTSQIKQTSVFDYIAVPIESDVSVEVANKLLRDIDPNFTTATVDNLKYLEVKNLMTYDTIFSQVPNSIISPAKAFNFVEITNNLQRITVSNPKFPGETVDNWTKISLGTYMDLESPYGEIVKLIRSKDSIFSFQPRGIAYLSILPEKQVATDTGSISLGKGNVLDNFQYLSIDSGCGNKLAIAGVSDKIFFIDTVNKTLNEIKDGELSTLKGFNSLASRIINSAYIDTFPVNDPETGLFVTINNHLKQVLFRIHGTVPTLVYNFATGYFTNSRTYAAYYQLFFNNRVFGAYNSNLYINDQGTVGDYYGTHQDASLQMFIEPVPGADKVFDAVQVMKNGDSNFSKIEVISPTRTSGIVPIEFKSKFDIHTAHLPRVENSRDRFRERNIKLNLTYEDTTPLDVDEVFVKFSIKKQ